MSREKKCTSCFKYTKLSVVATVDWKKKIEIISNSLPFAEVMAKKVHCNYDNQLDNLILQSLKTAFKLISCRLI